MNHHERRQSAASQIEVDKVIHASTAISATAWSVPTMTILS
jgi:hypothetical protein